MAPGCCILLLMPVLVTGRLNIPTKVIAPGVNMPVISIGTGGEERSNASVIVRNWMKLGGRGIDTAWFYKDQPAVAAAIAAVGVSRNDVFITTKIPKCEKSAVVKEKIESDLRDLKTSYIDLLLIHFPWGEDCTETWATLESYHASGIAKAIGVSNFNVSDLQSLLATAQIKPAVNQVRYNLFHHDDELALFAKTHNIVLEAYSPLGRNSSEIFSNPTIGVIGQKHKVSAAQIALKWVLQQGHVLTFQSSSEQHQAEDADVFRFDLTTSELDTLNNLQPQQVAHVIV